MHEHKIALVTGANKGIGRATAEQLAAQGMTALIGARDLGRGGRGPFGAAAAVPGVNALQFGEHAGVPPDHSSPL